jgi:TP901 family phage tail tape measure protein
LRIAANDYAEGALIFYQQGLGDDEVARRVEITAKSARAAGQSLEAMSSQLTAIWNTYQMTGDEMERAASVGAKMAGDTAVDFADIAEAMQTAAAPAEQMGVSYNSLAAIIATVGDTTQ